MTKNVLRVLIADDHPVVLAGLTALIQADPSLLIVGEARDGRTALSLVESSRPDVVVLDLSMPEMSGTEVARVLIGERPGCRILVLTVQEDGPTARRLLGLGVAGYLVKRSAAEELIVAIHTVGAGGTYIDPAIAGKLLRGHSLSGSLGTQDVDLLPREADVLRLIANGHSNREISTELGVTIRTIEYDKSRAMEKLGLKSRPEIVRYAATRGWISDGST